MKKITIIFEDTDKEKNDVRINRFFISEYDKKREPIRFSQDFELIYQHLVHLSRCWFKENKMKFVEEYQDENFKNNTD